MKHIGAWIKRRKKLLAALCLLAVLAAAWAAFSAKNRAAAAAAATAQVQTFLLEKGTVARTLSMNGTVQSAAAAQAATRLPYAVSEVLVQVGDTVAEGDVIARLDTTELDSQIQTQSGALASESQQAQLNVAQAQRRLEDARNQKKIYEERGAGDLSSEAWDDLLRQASLAIEDAQDALTNAVSAAGAPSAGAQQLAELKRQRAECEITAPAGGVITQVDAVPGAAATTIATIEDPAALQVQALASEYDVNQIQVGQAVSFTSGAKDEFSGTVAYVAPKATAGANGDVMYEVHITVDGAPTALRLGMSARIKVLLEQRRNVFRVPLDAVGADAEGRAVVYAKRTDAAGGVQFEPVPVTTGLESDLQVEISGAGLTEGMELRSLAETGDFAATMGG